MKSSHLNLYVVSNISVVTSTSPSLVQIPFVAHDYSSALPNILDLFIKPSNIVIEGISEDIHLLFDDIFNTFFIPHSLEIQMKHFHAFSFEIHLGLITSPYI